MTSRESGPRRVRTLSELVVAIGEVDHTLGSRLSPALRAKLAERLVVRLNAGRPPSSKGLIAEAEQLAGAPIPRAFGEELAAKLGR